MGSHLPGTYRVGPLPGTSLSTMRSKRANIAWVIRRNTCFVARPEGFLKVVRLEFIAKVGSPGRLFRKSHPGQLTRHLPGTIRVTHS